MSKQRNPKISLFDILDSAQMILDFTKGLDQDSFGKDLKTLSAVQHQLMIIGEATKRLDHSFRENYPNIPWKKMAGTRDILIHTYEQADYEIIWNICNNEIPSIIKKIDTVLNSL